MARLLRCLDRYTPGLAFLALLAVWEASCRIFAIPSFLLPAPSRIVHDGFQVAPAVWAGNIFATPRVALMGYALAILLGVPLAMALAKSRFLARTLYPMLVVVQSTPIVAVAPIIVVVLGAGDARRVLITFLIAFFPIVVSTTTGLMATPPEYIELSRSPRAGAWREYTQMRLPYALPYIFPAANISSTLAVIGTLVAEFVAAKKGLGFFISFSTSFFKIPQAFAGLAFLGAISLILFRSVGYIQARFAPWTVPKSEI